MRLSGKKRRILARDARRLLKEKAEMEGEVKMTEESDAPASCDTQPKPPSMDTS